LFGSWFILAILLSLSGVVAGADLPPRRGLEEVNHKQVELRGGFWGPRLKTHYGVTVPHALDCLERDGHVTNFDKAAGRTKGPLQGHHAFDSDLHKALEGALDSLQHHDDPGLRQRVEGILDRILAAQQKDGFLISYFIVQGLDKKWEDLRLEHQMYNAGHFFEMAIEHDRLSGNPKVLEAAKRFADHIDGVFGPGKRYDVDGHEEVELALIKLYRATGERRYLDLAKFFLDERGYAHGKERIPLDPKTVIEPPKPAKTMTPEQRLACFHARLRVRNGRMQDHKPVVQQHEAVGHAVRAGYLYSAMTDVVRFADAPGYESALDSIWSDVVGHKMYLTGNIGTGQYDDEGFGDPYLLPNESAYCESCAAISHLLWQHRMNLLKGEAKYADVVELGLYNGLLGGISISGDHYFYENPLASKGGARRSSWIGLSCCPTNLARIIPQIGGLAYARGKRLVYVNLYAAGEASIRVDDDVALKLAQDTNYPWDGRVRLTVTPDHASDFTVCLRIPGWALGRPVPSDLYRFADGKVPPIVLKINGQTTDPSPQQDGYVHLRRRWQVGDVVELDLPMPVQRVYAHDKVRDDQGKVALIRGPIVYCLEAADNPGEDLFRVTLPRESPLRAEHRSGLLGGVTVLRGEAIADRKQPATLTAVPYYAWANREPGAMTVWVAETVREIPLLPAGR
jgi:DUF1680 family protein